MPAIGTTTLAVSSNSIGNVASETGLVAAHEASFDGLLEVQIKVSAAEVQLQVSINDGSNDDTGFLNGGANLVTDRIYGPGELTLYQKAGYTYTFSMVYSSGTPLCDMLQIAEIDMRGDQ